MVPSFYYIIPSYLVSIPDISFEPIHVIIFHYPSHLLYHMPPIPPCIPSLLQYPSYPLSPTIPIFLLSATLSTLRTRFLITLLSPMPIDTFTCNPHIHFFSLHLSTHMHGSHAYVSFGRTALGFIAFVARALNGNLNPINHSTLFDSFLIGVSADSCPLNGPRKRRHLIRA